MDLKIFHAPIRDYIAHSVILHKSQINDDSSGTEVGLGDARMTCDQRCAL